MPHNSEWDDERNARLAASFQADGRTARERHNTRRARRRAERECEQAGVDWEDARTFLFRQWAAEDAATEQMLRHREKWTEEPDLSEEEIALADAVLDRLAQERRAEDEAKAAAAGVTAAPEEPAADERDYGNFIIPQWIDLTEEEEELLTQAALEWSQKRETIAGYLDAAMKYAQFERIEDGTIVGSFPDLPGLVADADTEEDCRMKLRDVLENWVLGVHGDTPIPAIDGITVDVDSLD